MLIAAGMVSEEQVKEALGKQRELGQRLGETLVMLGHISEAQMMQVLSNQLSVPWVNLYHVDFSRELLELIPAKLAEECCMVPVYVRNVRRHGDTLYVALDDPLNMSSLQQAADESGLPVKPMVASSTDIKNAIRVYYLGLPPLEEEVEVELASIAPSALTPSIPAVPISVAPSVAPSEAPSEAPPGRVSVVTEPPATLGEDTLEQDRAAIGAAVAEAEAVLVESKVAGAPTAQKAAHEAVAEVANVEVPAAAPVPFMIDDDAPSAVPSMPPPARTKALNFLTLTLLDGTTVKLPSPGVKTDGGDDEPVRERGLTTRDLIHALKARAAGEDVRDVLPDGAWEPLFAALLSVLLRKRLIADWEFVDEWNKERRKSQKKPE